MQDTYDLVVLGSGPAGEKAAAQAAYFGKRVAIVEKEPAPGGAAVHTGTLPSKTMRETALFLSGRQQRAVYGIGVTLDAELFVPKLLSRKDTVREQEVRRIHSNLDRHGVDYIRGVARLVDGTTVEVAHAGEKRALATSFVLVATGSIPHHPPEIDFDDPAIDDSDTILEIDSMPRSMVVLGGGVIGCEYTAMFAAMGVRVALVEPRDELLSFLDKDMSEALRLALIDLGVDVRLQDGYTGVRRQGDQIAVELNSGTSLACDRLLFAAGRGGCTAGLNLEAIGVKLAKRGYIEVDKDYRTNIPTVFAAGDVVGFPALASASMEQGRVAVCRAFGFDYKREVSELLPYGIYTIPEVSCVGLSQEDAEAKGIEVVAGRAPYSENARGKILGDTTGVIKLVFEKSTRKLLGAHCIGDKATELVHIGQVMILLGGTVDTLIHMVFNYPTLSECFKYAAYDALGRWKK